MNKKYCSGCLQSKSLDNFHKNSRNKDAHQDWCKDCVKEYKYQYREVNRVAISNDYDDYWFGQRYDAYAFTIPEEADND